MPETFYEVLGVEHDASTDEITAAYRERLKETHPDVSDDEDAEERVKKVIEAKDILTDETERERYDRLGHTAYVTEASVDADWGTDTTSGDDDGWSGPNYGSGMGDFSSTTTSTGGSGDSSDPSDTGEGRSEPGTGSGAESVYEGTWATNGENAGAEESTEGESGSDADGEQSGTTHASAGTNRHHRSQKNPDGSQKRRRGKHVSQTGANANAKNVGGSVGWATGVDGRHAVKDSESEVDLESFLLVPPRESVILLISTFISYPALVFSSVFPSFPLIVNIIVGACTLVLIAYLMSIPEVGTYVFGGWSLLATLIVIGYGIPVFSLVGLLILGSTWLPLGFTLLTFSVLRW